MSRTNTSALIIIILSSPGNSVMRFRSYGEISLATHPAQFQLMSPSTKEILVTIFVDNKNKNKLDKSSVKTPCIEVISQSNERLWLL